MKTLSLLASLCATVCAALQAGAEVKPAALFSDHMVLLSGATAPVWGTADPGERVTIKFAGQTRSTAADASG